jgi:hypothetical protein
MSQRSGISDLCGLMARGMMVSAIGATGLYAQPAPRADKPSIVIVDPMASDPLLVDGHSTDGPLTRHHVIFSRTKFGTRNMEIGYNNYLAGFKVDSAYAFKQTDGLCYVPAGEMEVTSNGVTVKLMPGMAMWRPAEAMTEHIHAAQDSITICAVSPARESNNAAQLGQNEVGRWTGDIALQPHVHFYSVEFIPPEPLEVKSNPNDAVIKRRIVSLHKDGSSKLDLTILTFKAGATLKDGRQTGEQFCWLEAGRLDLVSGNTISPMTARNFAYRPEGVAIDEYRARTTSTLICYSSPAAA